MAYLAFLPRSLTLHSTLPGSAHPYNFLRFVFCVQITLGGKALSTPSQAPASSPSHICPSELCLLVLSSALYHRYTCRQNPTCPRIYGTGKLSSLMSYNCAIWLHTYAGAGDRPVFWLLFLAAIPGVSWRIIDRTTMSRASWASCLSHLKTFKVLALVQLCVSFRADICSVSSSAQSFKGPRTYKVGEFCVGTKEPGPPVPVWGNFTSALGPQFPQVLVYFEK